MVELGPPTARRGVAVQERVAAFVVTWRRPQPLRVSLTAIRAQARRLDAIIVINNDPEDAVGDALGQEFPGVGVVTVDENLGLAGGFAEALYLADRCGFTWAWLLDDDAVPDPDALGELLAAAGRLRPAGRPPVILAPVQPLTHRPFGAALWQHRVVPVPPVWWQQLEPFRVDLAYWAGLLVHRSVVERIGYPRAEFFGGFADYEFCLRARRAGLEIVAVPASRLLEPHPADLRLGGGGGTGFRGPDAPAREYYEARNAAFTAWHTVRSRRAVAHLLLRQCRLTAGDLLRADRKLRRVGLRLRGTVDGLRGHLGRRPEFER